MPKVMKSFTLLADESGAVWVEGSFTQTQVKRVINSYKRAGITLTAYGSPNQLTAQLEQLSAVLCSEPYARAYRIEDRFGVRLGADL